MKFLLQFIRINAVKLMFSSWNLRWKFLLKIKTYQCCEADVFLSKSKMEFLLKINTYQCNVVDVFLLKFDMKFLLKIITYHCCEVDVFLLKFDTKFLLRINTYQCCEVDVFFLKCDENSLEINFARADSTQVQMLQMSTNKTYFNTCFHTNTFTVNQNHC